MTKMDQMPMCPNALRTPNWDHEDEDQTDADRLYRLLTDLDDARIHYTLERTRVDSVRVNVTVVGARVEIDVFEDGHIEVSEFRGAEDVIVDVIGIRPVAAEPNLAHHVQVFDARSASLRGGGAIWPLVFDESLAPVFCGCSWRRSRAPSHKRPPPKSQM
jgi:hypothetical protein